MNNFLGDTWNSGHAKFNPGIGSLGEEQLDWFEAELAQNKPSFVFIHYPLTIVQPVEVKDYGVHALIKRHRDSIQRVVSGHWHKWFEFERSFGPPHLVIADAVRSQRLPDRGSRSENDAARAVEHRSGGLEHAL